MSTTRDQYPEYKQYQEPEYKIIDDQVVCFSDICVHEFPMGDVEDPDLYAAQPIWEWQESEAAGLLWLMLWNHLTGFVKWITAVMDTGIKS